MNTLEIKLYDLFRKELNLPEEKAREAVQTVENVVQAEFAEQFASNRSTFKSDLKGDFDKVEVQLLDLRKEITRLEVKMSESKNDLIKWMLAFWFGQIAVLAGLLTFFFNYFSKK